MKKEYACIILFFFSFNLFAQLTLKDSIENESLQLKKSQEHLSSLKKIQTELSGFFKDNKQKKQKKYIDKNINSTEIEIIRKKILLYELRTRLPAKDSNAIAVKIDNVKRQGEIDTYTKLIASVNKEKMDLEKAGKPIKDSLLFIINDFQLKKESLENEVKMEKVQIFEQAELLSKGKLPFELTPEEELNTNDNPLVNQKKDVNDKYKLLVINEHSKKAFANTKMIYKARILNTNFTVPVARFNFNNEDNKEGNVILFNSIGAGFGVSWGRLEEIRSGGYSRAN